MFRFGKELMKKFGNTIYNYFLKGFTKHYRRYYIRGYGEGMKSTDLQKYMQECMDDIKVMDTAYTLWCKCANRDGYDELAIDILRFVKERTIYKGDMKVWKTSEYWQTARQTLDMKTGDCEDGAILILSLARLCGIPQNRIFLNCGYMINGGRHAYVTYRGDNTHNYILDWCAYYDRRRIPGHKTVADTRYKKSWWFVNDGGAYK